jgi:hypothetical protein
MKVSILLLAGVVLASNGAAYGQAVSSGMISSREHRTHLSHVAPAPTVSHRTSAVASNRKPSDPVTTGSIPKQ